jgi:hypothetical protein
LLTKTQLIEQLRLFTIKSTNKHGYVNITTEAMSEVLADLEACITIEYAEEVTDEQMQFDLK